MKSKKFKVSFCLLMVISLGIYATEQINLHSKRNNAVLTRLTLGYTGLGKFQIDSNILPWLEDSPLVITTYINQGFLRLFKNFEIYFQRVSWNEKLLVMTEDSDVVRYLQDKQRYFVLVLDGTSKRVSDAVDYGTVSYKKLIYSRTETVRILLNAHLRVLLVDIDAVWLRNPVEYLLHLAPMDIAGQLDGSMLCGGFLFMNGSSASINELWSNVSEQYRAHIEEDDRSHRSTEQGILNILLKNNYTHLKVVKLPAEDFPSGNLYFKPDTKILSPVVVHNNYIVGVDRKIERFKDYNLWLA